MDINIGKNNIIAKADDATPTYSGYRKQIIFILNKILLSKDDKLVFHPEGIEDLSIERDETVISVYQVKNLSTDLTLSDLFQSNKETPFIYRANNIINENPSTEIYVAHYNSLGKELRELSAYNLKTLEDLSNRISQKGRISKDSAVSLLNILKFQPLSEDELIDEITDVLSVSLTGIDVTAAIKHLCWWIFEASEKRKRVSKADTINEIQNIGKFIRERALHHEWLGAIQPMNEPLSDNEDVEQLKEMYTQGISATISHIINDLDIRRIEKLIQINNLFKESNIVIIHGASGQGKTSLALRYFVDYLPPELSYQIKEPGDRNHAYIIAEAVIKHHDAFNLPIFLFYDISPNDTNWSSLIEQLSQRKNIQILVSIREENWRKASYLNEKFDFKEIDLDFTQEEARIIFSHLNQHGFLDFENSWLQFGSKGPLLEYIYFLKSGGKLRDRLRAQIESLKKQANQKQLEPEALELLRIVALVTGCEARIAVDKIKSLINLPAPDNLLWRFEKEYLLHFSPESNVVEGFHPIRSNIIAEYLIDDTFSTWTNIFDKAFPSILEEDIGTFLFHVFSNQNTIEIDHVRESLNSYSPTKWNTYTGIITSLLWLGIKNYVESIRYLVEELKDKEPNLDFRVILDLDIGEVKPDLSDNLIKLLAEIAPRAGEIKKEYQKSVPDKKVIFSLLKEWLFKMEKRPENPITEGDYIGLSKAAFWIGYFQIQPVLLERIIAYVESIIDNLDILIIAELIYGFSNIAESDIHKIAKNRQELIIKLFCKKTGTITFEKTDTMVKAHYIIQIEPAGPSFITSDKENNNARSMVIVDMLRKLFPFMEYYSTQGYGHIGIQKAINILDKQNDDTFKKIPRNNLPSPYFVELNSICIGYIEYKYRPGTWQKYIEQIIYLRNLQLDCFDRLIKGLNRYFKKKSLNEIINEDTRNWLISYLNEINKIPVFPKISVDKWGLIRENVTDKRNGVIPTCETKKITSTPQRFEKFRENCNSLFNYCYFFANSAVTLITDRLKKEEHGDTRSSLILLDIYNYLLAFQVEFSQHFGNLVDRLELELIEKKELKSYSQFFSLWLFFCHRPESKINSDPKDFCLRYVNCIFKQRFLNSIKHGMTTEEDVEYLIKEGIFNDKKVLWVIADIKILDKLSSMEIIFSGIVAAFKKSIGEYEQNEIDRLLRYHWQNLCISFAYKSMILIPIVKQQYITSALFTENAPFIDIPCSDSVFEQSLNIAVWHSKQIDAITRLYSNFTTLRLLLGHIEEIIYPAECENAGKYIIDEDTLTQYIKEMTANSISKVFQDFLDSFVALHEMRNKFENPEEHKNFIDAFNLLGVNLKQFFPDPDQETNGKFETKLDTGKIKEWKKRLDSQNENLYSIFNGILIDSLNTFS